MVNAKVKTALRPYSLTCKTNQYYTQANCLTNTKSFVPRLLIKDPKAKKLKAQIQKPQPQKPKTFQHQSKLSKKTRKDQKQKGHYYDRDQELQAGSCTATRVNTIEVEPDQKQKKDENESRPDKACDLNKDKYYNCQKLDYYGKKCSNPKTQLQFRLVPRP